MAVNVLRKWYSVNTIVTVLWNCTEQPNLMLYDNELFELGGKSSEPRSLTVRRPWRPNVSYFVTRSVNCVSV